MPAPSSSTPPDIRPDRGLIAALAFTAAFTVANVYYAQPLVGSISESFGLELSAAGLIVTMIQLGYVAGLIFLVPLGDLVENKTLIIVALGCVTASLVLSALAPNAGVFIAASLLLGVTATATQMVVPFAAHLAAPERRGHVVGTVVSGLLFGVLLARPASTLLAGYVGWRGVYLLSALAMCAVIALMARVLPRREPGSSLTYAGLLRSLWHVLVSTPVLQRRAAYQSLLFAAFSLFWTGMPIVLTQPPFSLGHVALSVFLLSGATGALIAPIAGRLADRGHGRLVTGVAIATVAIGFALTFAGGNRLWAYVAAGIVLDAGVQANLVAGQRAILTLPAEIRSRLNALFLALCFLGGAVGSAISGYAVTHGSAATVGGIGFGFALIAVLLYATEFLPARKACAT